MFVIMLVVSEVTNNCCVWSGAPVKEATDNGHDEVANLLIEHGADGPDYKGECFPDPCQSNLPYNSIVKFSAT